MPNGANFVDLHVYVGGAGALDQPGTLYDYVYADQTPDFPLPFTYPPFAAVVFYPLHLLPFGLVAFAWQLGIIAALYGVVRISQRLLAVTQPTTGRSPCCGRPSASGSNRCAAHSTTGRSTCCWCWPCCTRCTAPDGGCRAAGRARGRVKLTPAVSGLYFLGVRRWGTVVFSAVVFFGTVAVSALVVGDQTRYYFTELARRRRTGRTDRHVVQPVLARRHLADSRPRRRIRAAGAGRDRRHRRARDAGVARRRGASDRLGGIVVVQLFGLLLSPISWTHHWVWLIPADDLATARPAARAAGRADPRLGVAGLTLVGVPWLLSFAQPTIWEIRRPWYLAWAGLIYIVATLATLAWIAATGRRSDLSPEPSSDRSR